MRTPAACDEPRKEGQSVQGGRGGLKFERARPERGYHARREVRISESLPGEIPDQFYRYGEICQGCEDLCRPFEPLSICKL